MDDFEIRKDHSKTQGREKATPPVNEEPAPPGPSRFLREDERIHIADRLREDASLRTIAAELGRSQVEPPLTGGG